MPIPTPPYVVIGGKRIVCTTYTADDTFEYFVPVEKIAYGADAGTDVDVNTPLPTSDSQTLAELVAFAAANHTDTAAVTAAINAFAAANHTDEAAVTAAVNAFAAAQHADSGSLLTELGVIATALAPLATGARQDALKTSLDAFLAANHTDLSTLHTDLAGLLTELLQKVEPSDLSALATAANQATLKTAVDAVTAKLTADPATQTTLAAILAKLTADPSTGAAQATQATKLDTLHTDLGHLTDGNLKLQPATATAFADAGTIASANYRGITIKNTSSTATAEIAVRQTNATGTILDIITLAAGESVREHYPSGRTTGGTIYMQLVAGTVSGSVFSS